MCRAETKNRLSRFCTSCKSNTKVSRVSACPRALTLSSHGHLLGIGLNRMLLSFFTPSKTLDAWTLRDNMVYSASFGGGGGGGPPSKCWEKLLISGQNGPKLPP